MLYDMIQDNGAFRSGQGNALLERMQLANYAQAFLVFKFTKYVRNIKFTLF